MTEQAIVSGGDSQQDASGTAGEGQQGTAPSTQKDVVQYQTYQKVLGEKKKMQEQLGSVQKQLDELLAAQKQAEEQKLAENQEFKKLLDLRTQELEKTSNELNSMRAQHANAQKLDAFLGALGGRVDRKYWGLIDLDQVVLDPESGQVDEMSVTKLVESFRAEHGRLIDTPNSKKLPNEFPKGVQQPGGFRDLSLKEQMAKAAEYIANNRR